MSYPTFTPEELIIDWFNRSQKRAEGFTLFDQFISLWLAFNSWGTYLSNEDRDWRMLDYLETNTELLTIYRMLMENDREFLGKVRRLAKYRVLDMRPGHENESKSITDYNDFGQLLDVIYQIRCNLFHGRKSETEQHDRELVELAHYILSKIFTPIVEKLQKE